MTEDTPIPRTPDRLLVLELALKVHRGELTPEAAAEIVKRQRETKAG